MIWREGAIDAFPDPGDEPFAWLVRLDDPAVDALAGGARLGPDDLADLAGRPQAAMRAVRRRLSKLAIARLADVHPDAVTIGRSPSGAPRVIAPEGWCVSVAGRFPFCLIGVSRKPVGVDVEPADADPPPDDALTADEIASLAGAAAAARVTRWVAKESHAKLFGVASRAEAVAIATKAEKGSLVFASSGDGRSACRVVRARGFIAAVATLTA